MTTRHLRYECLRLACETWEIKSADAIAVARQFEAYLLEVPYEDTQMPDLKTAADGAPPITPPVAPLAAVSTGVDLSLFKGVGATEPAPPPPAAETTKPPKEDKYTIFHPDGTKRAGFMHSKDALSVMTTELGESCHTPADMDGFQRHNMPAITKLAKADLQTFMTRIAEHVDKIKAAMTGPTEAGAATTPTGDVSLVTPPSVSLPTTPPAETAGTGQTVMIVASPSDVSDAALAAAFAGGKTDPIAMAALPEMSKDDFVKNMLAFSKQVGAQESGAWLLSQGYDNILKVPADKYPALCKSAEARATELKGS